jgi:hypothetical protein
MGEIALDFITPLWCYALVPVLKKKSTRFHLEVATAEQLSSHGGQVLVDALARRFSLWDRLAAIDSLDPRKRRSSGFSPTAIVAQILLGFCSGATSLADMDRLGSDPVLLGLFGLDAGADQSTLGEWLRAQSDASVEAVMNLNRTLVAEVLAKANPARVLHAGRPVVFFDDTEIEVDGKTFEGARINYEGSRALSWQTLWVGPFVADAILDGAPDPSQHLGELLAANRHLWAGQQAHFHADSASSAAKSLARIDQAGFGSWTVSYNQWTEKLDALAAELPESAWTSEAPGEDGLQEAYGWLKHQPGEAEVSYRFACVRRKAAGEMFWRHAYVVGDDTTEKASSRGPKLWLERHRLKGASEQGFSHLLRDLDLHHPPCQKLVANQMYYALGILAYNLLAALRVLDLPDDAQSWRLRAMIRNLLIVPVKVSTHARKVRATICVPAGWMRWWRVFLQDHGPKRPHGGLRVRLDEDGC